MMEKTDFVVCRLSRGVMLVVRIGNPRFCRSSFSVRFDRCRLSPTASSSPPPLCLSADLPLQPCLCARKPATSATVLISPVRLVELADDQGFLQVLEGSVIVALEQGDPASAVERRHDARMRGFSHVKPFYYVEKHCSHGKCVVRRVCVCVCGVAC